MKPCPSPNCGLTDDHKLDYSDPNVNVLGRNGQNQVTCICGVRGPWADSYEEAVALWDALPRQEDVDKLRGALGEIVIWAEAYAPEIWPDYSDTDMAKIMLALNGMGYSMDRLSANLARHIVDGVGDIARKALEVSDD